MNVTLNSSLPWDMLPDAEDDVTPRGEAGTTCSVPECLKRRHKKARYCAMHQKRIIVNGHPESRGEKLRADLYEAAHALGDEPPRLSRAAQLGRAALALSLLKHNQRRALPNWSAPLARAARIVDGLEAVPLPLPPRLVYAALDYTEHDPMAPLASFLAVQGELDAAADALLFTLIPASNEPMDTPTVNAQVAA